MHLYKRGDVWWISWPENGITNRKSTKQTSRHAAQTAADKWAIERANPHLAAQNEASLNDAALQFVKLAKLSGKSESTLEIHLSKAGHLVRLLPPLLKDVNTKSVDAYFEARRSEGAAMSTMNKEWKTLNGILRESLRRELWIGNLEVLKPSWVRESYTPRKRRLTWRELELLMGTMSPNRAAALAFVVATGARFGEYKRAMRADIGLDAVLLRGTKTKSAVRSVPIVELFRFLMERVRRDADGVDGKLFSHWCSALRDMQVACERVNIPRVSWNDLRRTFATLLHEAGVPNQHIATMLGHTSTAMVERVYAKPNAPAVKHLVDSHVKNQPVFVAYVKQSAPLESKEESP